MEIKGKKLREGRRKLLFVFVEPVPVPEQSPLLCLRIFCVMSFAIEDASGRRRFLGSDDGERPYRLSTEVVKPSAPGPGGTFPLPSPLTLPSPRHTQPQPLRVYPP